MNKLKNPDVALLMVIVVVLGCVWGYSTAFHAFDDDEFQHANIAWLMREGERPYSDFFEHHLVLYHGAAAPLFSIGEDRHTIFVLRALSLVAGTLTLLLLYMSGRRLGASPHGAIAGVWMLGLTPMFVLKMTEARPEAPAMAAMAAAIYFLCAGVELKNYAKSDSFPWRAATIGLMAAAAALLSQKYAVVSLALVAAVWPVYGRRRAMQSFAVFAASLILYAAWMAAMGVAREAFDLVVMLNLRWRYSFSPAGYATELYISAGALTVTGLIGIVRSVMQAPRRKGLTPGIFFASSLALIILVPVPYRQSFLPLLAALALGSMLFCTPLFTLITAASNGRRGRAAAFVLTVLLGAASLYTLPEHLSPDNRRDLALMAAMDEYAPEGPVFDGRKLMFWRPHIGYHACMHEEILMMIDKDKYAEDVLSGLKEAGLPPVIRDYRVENMPERITIFIREHYLTADGEHHGSLTNFETVYVAGLHRDRIMPAAGLELEVPADGYWRIAWKGGDVSLNSRRLKNGKSILLREGKHGVSTDTLVRDFRIERDYRRGGLP